MSFGDHNSFNVFFSPLDFDVLQTHYQCTEILKQTTSTATGTIHEQTIIFIMKKERFNYKI